MEGNVTKGERTFIEYEGNNLHRNTLRKDNRHANESSSKVWQKSDVTKLPESSKESLSSNIFFGKKAS